MTENPDSSYDSKAAHRNRSYKVEYLGGIGDVEWLFKSIDNDKMVKLFSYKFYLMEQGWLP